MKRALIFQHMDHDTAGRFMDFFAEDGIEPDTVRLWEGQPIPDLANYDLLLVLGGAMDVWEVDLHPWLGAEKLAIREWVLQLARPYIGLCLGPPAARRCAGRHGRARRSRRGRRS